MTIELPIRIVDVNLNRVPAGNAITVLRELLQSTDAEIVELTERIDRDESAEYRRELLRLKAGAEFFRESLRSQIDRLLQVAS